MAHILLVEDNDLNRDMLSRRLRRRGHEVAIAVDGADAIAAVAAHPPDLILMDMSLPIMDGWEATKALKADNKTSHIPIIALTAHAMAGEREKALRVGCDDYDTKPVEIRRLIKKMDIFLGQGSSSPSRSLSPQSPSPISFATPTAPYPPASPASLAPLAPSVSSASPPPLAPPTRSDGTGTFLVVDDNVNNRDLLKRRLTRTGHVVMAVESGEAALEVLNPNHPNYHPVDMVLLDVMMPGMDGIETLQRIRQAYSQLQLPVIMVTAKDSNQDMLRAFDLGANDYITKPIDFDVAIARIQNQLLTVQAVRGQMAQHATPSVSVPQTSSPAPLPFPPIASPPPVVSPPPAPYQPPSVASPTPLSFRPPSPPPPPPPFRPSSPSPTPFRPPVPMANGQRDRLNNRYDVGQVLTTDIFSQLLLAKDIQHPDQPLYFLKKIDLSRLPLGVSGGISKRQVMEFLQQDMGRLQAISQNAYISSLVDFFYPGRRLFFTVQNFVEGELFANMFQRQGPLSFTQAVPLLKEMFGVLDFIHQHRVAHGEIHAHHLVHRQSDDRLVLVDLGLTQRVLNYLTPNAVADIGFIQGYMPPEQCEGQLLFSSDVYALGMLMLQAMTGKTPEYINRDEVTGELKWRELTDVDDKTSEVIQKMVYQNYAERYAYPEQASKDLLFQWYTLRFKRSLS